MPKAFKGDQIIYRHTMLLAITKNDTKSIFLVIQMAFRAKHIFSNSIFLGHVHDWKVYSYKVWLMRTESL